MAEREGLVVELWYEALPDLTDPVLLEGLRAVSPGSEARDGSLFVPYDGGEVPARTSTSADGDGQATAPLVSMVMPGSALGVEGKSLPDASQTWDWPGVDEALGRARGSLLVVEMFGGPYGVRDRVAALVGVDDEQVDRVRTDVQDAQPHTPSLMSRKATET